jgi:hypothetical protein
MRKLLMAAGIAGPVMAALTAFAQATSPVSDSLTVYDPNHNIVASVIATEADEAANGPNFIYSIPATSVAVDTSKFGNYTVLVEPDGTLSDIFGIASVNGALALSFSSDTDPGSFSQPPGSIVLPETGDPVDATMYLDPQLQARGYTAAFQSDADTVPDGGATAGLLVLGMLSLGALRKSSR